MMSLDGIEHALTVSSTVKRTAEFYDHNCYGAFVLTSVPKKSNDLITVGGCISPMDRGR